MSDGWWMWSTPHIIWEEKVQRWSRQLPERGRYVASIVVTAGSSNSDWTRVKPLLTLVVLQPQANYLIANRLSLLLCVMGIKKTTFRAVERGHVYKALTTHAEFRCLECNKWWLFDWADYSLCLWKVIRHFANPLSQGFGLLKYLCQKRPKKTSEHSSWTERRKLIVADKTRHPWETRSWRSEGLKEGDTAGKEQKLS